MTQIRITGSNIRILNKKVLATLETVYGIGRVRANKISNLLLTNPRSKTFRSDLVELSQELKTQRIFKSIILDNGLKLLIYSNLEKLSRIGSYRAHRILQNLPSKGQRTHTNAGTPNRLNPFVALGLKQNLTNELLLNNKKWELINNGRSTDLLEVNSKVARKKYSKAASVAKKKKVITKPNKKKK